MTTTPNLFAGATASPRSPVHLLGRAEIRRGLEAHLRRRVPPQDVEDVTQSVLAAAVAAPAVPSDPDELRRWLSAIARNKVADFHRGRARSRNLIAEDQMPDAVGSAPAAFEEREVLRALLEEKRSPREEAALRWLLREHDGERLVDIATENGVAAPVVRQRVSRLRRALRSRWAIVVGLAAVATALAFAFHDPAAEPIAKDAPVVPTLAGGATELAAIADGEWIVSEVRPARALTPFERTLVDGEASGAKLVVHGNRVDLQSRSGAFKTSWKIARAKTTPTTARLVLVGESGKRITIDVALHHDPSGPRLEATLHDARFGGTVTLRRPAR